MADEVKKDNDSIKLTPEMKSQIKDIAADVVKDVAMQAVFAAGATLLTSLIVTSYKKTSISGTKEVVPTKDVAVVADKKEVDANTNSAALAKDDVAGQKGKVEASDTDAQAAKTDARATEGGAQAVKTKAGAMDVATKAMKIN